jgi:adenylate kinase family enzyme
MATPKKINVVGTSGSGKSTFARRLGEAIGQPHIEMDKVFWGPNWAMPKDEDFFANLRKALEGKDGWVLDGNYTRTIPIKWEKVDLVIWLDISFPRTFFQALKRALHRSWTGRELWEGTGNRETFTKTFLSKESILLWTWNTYGPVKEKYERMLADPKYSHVKFLRLRGHGEAEAFLEKLRKAPAPANT